jgi:hypothetical protein
MGDPKGAVFRTIGRGTNELTMTPLPQANVYAMIRRRAAPAGKNGGTLEKAAAMAYHASTRTTQLYDRRRDEVSLEEVERVVI